MTKHIVMTGGGSGGHITPILAVATELKRRDPKIKTTYIGQKGDSLGELTQKNTSIDESYNVRAGKFRRYHGEGWHQIFDLRTLFLNIRDFFYVCIGFWQSRRLLKRLRPSLVFVKGGFVGVPVGLAAATLKIPYVTHDSDAIPGLANRIIARWARRHAVALPAELYRYPADKTVTTGIPLRPNFTPVNKTLNTKYRTEIGVPKNAPLVFIIGGGLGSQRVNAAVIEALPHVMREHPTVHAVHVVGRANEASVITQYEDKLSAQEQKRLTVFGFISDVYKYSGAADVVITRAGATNLAEFAVQGRACIIVPSPFLTGGHQLKNAQYLADQHAAVVLPEEEVSEDPNRLARTLSDLLRNEQQRLQLGATLAKFAQPKAASLLADLLLQEASSKDN